MKFLILRCLMLAAVVTATGCSGGASTTGNSVCPAFGCQPNGGIGLCPDVIGPAPTLVSPANGSTNVSTSIGNLQINGQTNTSVLVTLTPSAGTTLTQTDSVFHATGNGLNASLSIPLLAARTSYTVALTDLGQCGHTYRTLRSARLRHNNIAAGAFKLAFRNHLEQCVDRRAARGR